jgi:hypothetical protein
LISGLQEAIKKVFNRRRDNKMSVAITRSKERRERFEKKVDTIFEDATTELFIAEIKRFVRFLHSMSGPLGLRYQQKYGKIPAFYVPRTVVPLINDANGPAKNLVLCWKEELKNDASVPKTVNDLISTNQIIRHIMIEEVLPLLFGFPIDQL